jgi:catechol 2,3-dioxygenase-like lactoylglutathione lyase family enzyme
MVIIKMPRIGFRCPREGVSVNAVPFHVGVIVPNLDETAAILEQRLGLEISDPLEAEYMLSLSDGRDAPAAVRVRFTRGPGMQLELIEPVAGEFFPAVTTPTLHHIGAWCPSMEPAWRTEGRFSPGTASFGPDGEFRAWYLDPEDTGGIVIELVHESRRAVLEAL